MVPKSAMDLILPLIIADVTLLDGADIGLFTDGPEENDPDAVLGDFTAASFTGYAAVATVAADWDVAISGGNVPYASHDPVEYTPTNGTNLPQLIVGYYIFNGAVLLDYKYLPVPLSVTVADQVLHVTPQYVLGMVSPLPAEGHIT